LRIKLSKSKNAARPEVNKVNLWLYYKTGDKSLLPRLIPGDIVYVPGHNRNWLEKTPQSTVRLLGAVGKVGRYDYQPNMTILDLLAEAGGPSGSAYLKRIVVINFTKREQRARTFNMLKFMKTGDPRLLPVLRPGDTVYVPNLSDSFLYRTLQIIRDLTSVFFVYRTFTG